jgi:drug/metabolite transporter (DMT)-like permease
MNLRKNGVFLMLVGNLFFALIPITVKWANQLGYSTAQAIFFRFAFATAGILFLTVLGWQKLNPVNYQALLWRGFFGGSSVFFYFLALHWTTASKGTVLNYTYSIWANIYAVLYLKHKAPKGFAFLLLMAMVGVWLVLDVHFGKFNWGDLAGVLSGAVAGAATVATKEARRTDNALTVFGSFTFFGLFIAVAMLLSRPYLGAFDPHLTQWTPLTFRGLFILLGMGATSMAAQMFFTEGYGYASLATGTLLSLMVPVLTAFFGIFILNETLTPHFISGTILVLTACGIFGWNENKERRGSI